MSKQKKNATPPAPSADVKPDAVVYANFDKSLLVDIALIDPCPFQKRKLDRNAPKVKQHIASNAERGTRTPIKARPSPTTPGRFENVYGGLRVFAGLDNGRTIIPCIVQELTDEEARVEHAIENLDRADLDPREEAQTIKDFRLDGQTAAQIAVLLRREEKWVAKKLVLADLEQEWFDEWAKTPDSWDRNFARNTGEPSDVTAISEFTVGHMEVIARMPLTARAELLAEFREEAGTYLDVPSVTELEREISRKFTQLLSAAPFKLDDSALDPKAGACNDCPKRSSCAKLLWADMKDAETGDRCLDKSCWERKTAALVALKKAETESKLGQPVKLVSIDYQKTHGKDAAFVSPYDLSPLPKSKGGVPALHTDGPKAGTVEFVQPERHGARSDAEKPSAPRSMKERREALHRRRIFLRVTNFLEALGNKKKPFDTPKFEIVAKLVAVFGTDTRSQSPEKKHWTDFDGLKKQTEIAERLWVDVRPVIANVLTPRGSMTDHKLLDSSAERIAAILGWDWEGAWATAVTEIPEPKSWSSESGHKEPAPDEE